MDSASERIVHARSPLQIQRPPSLPHTQPGRACRRHNLLRQPTQHSRINIALILTRQRPRRQNHKLHIAHIAHTPRPDDTPPPPLQSPHNRHTHMPQFPHPHADSLLQLADPDPEHTRSPTLKALRDVHIALPAYYAPRGMVLLDPKTEDGRVVFLFPWEGETIAGTTDTPVAPVPAGALAGEGEEPAMVREEEIRWALDEVRKCLAPDVGVSRTDVLSARCGLRPLVVSA
ncbi:hypothetical protein H2248_007086 [Termitomyces sp. 'cryptogamus']|nr:hypothetical protein H2248_007086 [Termitomyces sp. 'cryptogamus']